MIHNNYLSDTNSLKVGYIIIWELNSTDITQVTVSYDNQQFMVMNFKSDPYNQVCLKRMLSYHTLILFSVKLLALLLYLLILERLYIFANVDSYCTVHISDPLRIIQGSMINDLMESSQPYFPKRLCCVLD